MCVYCLLKMRLGVLKVSLCIYLVFGFLRSYLAFLWVDLAFCLWLPGNPGGDFSTRELL